MLLYCYAAVLKYQVWLWGEVFAKKEMPLISRCRERNYHHHRNSLSSLTKAVTVEVSVVDESELCKHG